jgi:hypothetical protein
MGEPITFLLYGLAALGLYLALRTRLARHAAPPAGTTVEAPPPAWSLALLVEVDTDERQLQPRVQIRPHTSSWTPWIRLELVDRGGEVRARRALPLPLSAIGADLTLPRFEPPGGASLDETLGWHWDVVIYDQEREYARWREHPRPAGMLNPEAELG